MLRVARYTRLPRWSIQRYTKGLASADGVLGSGMGTPSRVVSLVMTCSRVEEEAVGKWEGERAGERRVLMASSRVMGSPSRSTTPARPGQGGPGQPHRQRRGPGSRSFTYRAPPLARGPRWGGGTPGSRPPGRPAAALPASSSSS